MPKTWACPFFVREEVLCVRCEMAKLEFPDQAGRRAYIDAYCASADGWESCTMASHLCQEYERREVCEKY